MNKKFIGISATSIASILIAIAFVISPPGSSGIETFEETFVPGLTPPPLPMETFLKGNQVKDLREASTVLGKTISAPTYVPKGYKIQLISATEEGIKMYATSKKLMKQTTDQEFVWNQQGITINITPMSDDRVRNQIVSQLQENPQYEPIVINGKLSAGHEIHRFMIDGMDEVSSSQAQLLYYNNDNKIVVHGLHPLGELAKIAASIP